MNSSGDGMAGWDFAVLLSELDVVMGDGTAERRLIASETETRVVGVSRM